jgi:hypothetical protein
VRAHRQRGQRGDASQPPLAAGRLTQGAAEAAELPRQHDRQVAGLLEQPEIPGERDRVSSGGAVARGGAVTFGGADIEISAVQLVEQGAGKQVTGPDGWQWTSLAACS